MSRLVELPLLLLLAGVASLSMWVPAIYALALEHFHDARTFFYAGLMGMIFVLFVSLAQMGREHNKNPLRQLLGLLVAYLVLPAFLAMPFQEAVRNTTFVNAYFEMVSSMTTTGATLFAPDRLDPAEHLWRGLVGWQGGLLLWISAAAILAPLTLGGFEVTAASEPGQTFATGAARRDYADPRQRLARACASLIPVYVGLTASLWVMLMALGDTPFIALMHAMSTMATSGISPINGLAESGSGRLGEMLIFLFLLFALTRLTFSNDTSAARRQGIWYDPEFRMGAMIVAIVPIILFTRHWIASFEVAVSDTPIVGLQALWGAIFTTLSFLTTAGFESADWSAARSWSGLGTPGLILMGLAITGGGVATTAGGVKLLRVFILYLNGRRELERLIHPSSVGRSGLLTRRTRREGAFIAWVFFMIFALTLSGLVMAFAASGVTFEPSFVMAVAALTNTGPVVNLAAEVSLSLSQLDLSAKLFFCAGMILGRLEVLAIVVMVTPELWRD